MQTICGGIRQADFFLCVNLIKATKTLCCRIRRVGCNSWPETLKGTFYTDAKGYGVHLNQMLEVHNKLTRLKPGTVSISG